jgi:hypothetical protein
MSWIKDLLKSVTTGDGLATKLIDTVSGYIPSKEDRARLEIEIRSIAHAQELEIQRAELEAKKAEVEEVKELNARIKDLEGTAKDLMQAGYAGRIVLFLRGAQRPLWGWSVMLMDIRVYLGSATLGDQEMKLLYALNLLVGSFLFGERAIKNVMPFFKDMIESRKK